MKTAWRQTATAWLVGCTIACGGEPAPSVADGSDLHPFNGGPEAALRTSSVLYANDSEYDESEVSTDAGDRLVLRTQLEVLFTADATLTDLERVLRQESATVTYGLPSVSAVVVRIPDPESLEELDAVVERIEADPSVWFVRRAVFPTRRRLPPTARPVGQAQPELQHHLAVRGPAAWNARRAATTMPTLVVADFFGGGLPQGLDAELVPEHFSTSGGTAGTARGFRLPAGAVRPAIPATPSGHGYHISGVAAARFGGPNTPQGRATGILPVRARLDAADGRLAGPLGEEYLSLQRALTRSGPIALNYSVGWACEGQVDPGCESLSRRAGGAWADKVRQTGLESRTLMFVASGNILADSWTPTLETSHFILAASVRDDLLGPDGAIIPPLVNVVSVGAAATVEDSGDDPESVECLAQFSFVGSDVSAVGTRVHSTLFADGADARDGTSMAAPQAAGLAAYMWAVRPDLTPTQVKEIIVNTARPTPVLDAARCSTHPTPAPNIDAYGALLALDQGRPDLPVRSAILDLDDDGIFDETDVSGLLARMEAADGRLDYGRADLNGDGYTGGTRSLPFDLNANGDTADRPELLVANNSVALDETAVTDLDILCHAAFSLQFDRPADGMAAVEEACGGGGGGQMGSLPTFELTNWYANSQSSVSLAMPGKEPIITQDEAQAVNEGETMDVLPVSQVTLVQENRSCPDTGESQSARAGGSINVTLDAPTQPSRDDEVVFRISASCTVSAASEEGESQSGGGSDHDVLLNFRTEAGRFAYEMTGTGSAGRMSAEARFQESHLAFDQRSISFEETGELEPGAYAVRGQASCDHASYLLGGSNEDAASLELTLRLTPLPE